MAKRNPQDELLKSDNNFRTLIEFNKAMKSNFTLEFSTYTARLILQTESGEFKTKLITEKRNNSVFIAGKLIEKDLRNYTANEIQKVNEKKLQYYSHALKPCSYKEVMNIDIKNAYASILFNDGFISPETFQYLEKIQKLDRLASLGMLAYKRNIFEYVEGELKNTSVKIGEFRDVFFYCVRKTAEIMRECEEVLGKDFLFTWVDGIYFRKLSRNIILVSEILETHKLKYTIEKLSKFEVSEVGEIYFITFGGNKGDKFFNIPKYSYSLRNSFYEYFNEQQKPT